MQQALNRHGCPQATRLRPAASPQLCALSHVCHTACLSMLYGFLYASPADSCCPSLVQVVPGFRVRTIPVLGTMPAIFGMAAASYILCQLAGQPFTSEPLFQLQVWLSSCFSCFSDALCAAVLEAVVPWPCPCSALQLQGPARASIADMTNQTLASICNSVRSLPLHPHRHWAG